MNYNNQSNIKSNHIKSDGDRIRCDQKEQTINAYAELVKKNIDFDVLLHTYSREQDLVEEIYQLILETVQTEKDMIRIAGEYYPAGFVKGKFWDGVRCIPKVVGQASALLIHEIYMWKVSSQPNAPLEVRTV